MRTCATLRANRQDRDNRHLFGCFFSRKKNEDRGFVYFNRIRRFESLEHERTGDQRSTYRVSLTYDTYHTCGSVVDKGPLRPKTKEIKRSLSICFRLFYRFFVFCIVRAICSFWSNNAISRLHRRHSSDTRRWTISRPTYRLFFMVSRRCWGPWICCVCVTKRNCSKFFFSFSRASHLVSTLCCGRVKHYGRSNYSSRGPGRFTYL